MPTDEFDSAALALIFAALDRVWDDLPAGDASEKNDRMLEALLKAARTGERDPKRLGKIAFAAALPAVAGGPPSAASGSNGDPDRRRSPSAA
jgi:hypothetical protein